MGGDASGDKDYSDPVQEYSLAETEGFRYALPAKELAAGEYTVALFRAKGASTPRVCEQFTITEGAVYTAKTQYRQNEEIVFSFYADTVNRGDGDYCWLGLYKKQDRESYGNDFLKWVTLCVNPYISKDTTPSENLRHEGWYARVYEDKVVFLGREFTTVKWLAGACLVFDF